MTRDEILNMPAGREMDALIWKHFYKSQHPKPPVNDFPSTDIACAWDVAERMRRFNLFRGAGYWSCEYAGQYLERVDAETAPLAICRAALLEVFESA